MNFFVVGLRIRLFTTLKFAKNNLSNIKIKIAIQNLVTQQARIEMVDVSGNSASSGVRQSMSTRGLRSIYKKTAPIYPLKE